MHISYILNHLAESKTQPHYDDFLLSAVSIGHQPLPGRGSRQLLKEVSPVAQCRTRAQLLPRPWLCPHSPGPLLKDSTLSAVQSLCSQGIML